MPRPMHIVPLTPAAPLDRGPLAAAACWRQDQPLLFLGSGRPQPPWSRWSILASPQRWVVLDGREADPPAVLASAMAATRLVGEADDEATWTMPTWTGGATVDDLPFAGGWIGFLSYELGRVIEPAVRGERGVDRAPLGHRWPLAAFAWCPTALVHDSARGLWWTVGPPGRAAPRLPLAEEIQPPAAWSLEPWEETVRREEWEGEVARTIEYIRAGDIFQANLAHLLRSRLRGSVRAMALAALEAAEPWHGAYLELPDGSALVSLSPELFLKGELSDPRRRSPGYVVTRPIKGTRPDGADAESLMDSEKDAAELNMIVDLMRNDLGRVCVAGSVRVSEDRHVERHPTVQQCVATVEGTLRDDVDVAALLRATFPPGSVTGAPKIRAMQVIESLEPHARGPYCGAIGFFSDSGRFGMNVAIRTLAVAPPSGECREVAYGVGCGIVADSDPAAEWEESLVKSAVVRGPWTSGTGAGGSTGSGRTGAAPP